MAHVDGFVAAVPTANRDAYLAHASDAAAVFRKLGAVRVVECWGTEVPDGELTSFPMAVRCGPDETVVFSWVEWPDKPTRDAGIARLAEEMNAAGISEMPFDGKRLIYGGFELLLDA